MRNEPMLHHIQKGILLSLASKSPLRFTELQPPRVPNNTFSYHLGKLIASDYIQATKDGYIATRKGLKFIASGNGVIKKNSSPLILTMLYVTNMHDEVLLLNRNHKPFQGWYGVPSGIIHTGETIDQAAKREFFEQTTVEPEGELEKVGVLDFQYLEKETQDVFVHAIAFVYRYEYTGDTDLLADLHTKYGQLSWSMLGRKHILPEVHAVKELLNKDTRPYVSASFEEPVYVPTLPIRSKAKTRPSAKSYPSSRLTQLSSTL